MYKYLIILMAPNIESYISIFRKCEKHLLLRSCEVRAALVIMKLIIFFISQLRLILLTNTYYH